MNKDIYELLNNGDFHEEEYENVYKKDFNDLEIKNIKKFVKKNSKAKSKNKAIKIGVAAAACILMLGICNTTIRTEVLASVSNIISKIDPNKNYESDYVVELNDSYSKNGVEIKLDECYRSMNKIRLVYTMNFEDKVPESIKAKERMKSDLELDGLNYEYVDYMNKGIEGCKININDWTITDEEKLGYYNCKYGVLDYESRDIEITEKSIKKEVIFTLESYKVEDDLNIKINYENIVKDSGKKINGPWEINYKVNMEENTIENIEKTKFDKDYGYKYDENRIVTIDSYANTNTGIKIFGTETNFKDMPTLCLEGTDNFGNKIIMFPRFLNLEAGNTNGAEEVIFELYDGQTDNRQSLAEGVTSLKLALYAQGDEKENYKYKKIGEEFTIDIQ